MAHGFGGVRGAGLDAIARRFADAGATVLLFDYRYLGTSDGEPRGLIEPTRQRDDYRAAISYARSLAGVDPDRIVLWGTSFSAGHVCTVAAEDRRIVAAIVQNPYVNGLAALHYARRTTSASAVARLSLRWAADEVAALLGRAPHRVALTGPPGATAVFTAPGAHDGYASILPPRSADRRAIGWEPTVPARVLVRLLLDRPDARASAIQCPLLVAACGHDKIAPVGPAVRLSRNAPQGELVLYPADHFDVFTTPLAERVRADQINFLQRIGVLRHE